MQFEPHGFFNIEVTENSLICQLEGSWNIEQARLFEDAVKTRVFKHFSSIPWYKVSVFASEAVGSPDVTEIEESIFDWERKHGCVLHAVITTSVLVKGMLQKIYVGKNDLIFFDTIEEAKCYADAFLANPVSTLQRPEAS